MPKTFIECRPILKIPSCSQRGMVGWLGVVTFSGAWLSVALSFCLGWLYVGLVFAGVSPLAFYFFWWCMDYWFEGASAIRKAKEVEK